MELWNSHIFCKAWTVAPRAVPGYLNKGMHAQWLYFVQSYHSCCLCTHTHIQNSRNSFWKIYASLATFFNALKKNLLFGLICFENHLIPMLSTAHQVTILCKEFYGTLSALTRISFISLWYCWRISYSCFRYSCIKLLDLNKMYL